MAEGHGFLQELKRRHVWRVAIAYVLAAWLIVQVATQVFPFFHIPNWAVRLVVILLVIGFPVAVGFAWVYEMTPEGIRRTAPADSSEARAVPESRSVGRRLDAIIIAVLVLAVALMGWRLSTVRRAPAGTATTTSTGAAHPHPGNVAPVAAPAAKPSGQHTVASAAIPAPVASIPQKSVAVLPFANESGKPDEQFFSDGLSEDLINALSQFDGLKVISRDSAFQFRNSKDSAAEIGKALGVAHLLEGSVRRQNDEVRISAELVNAADGTIAWSHHYDRPYQDLFALQDAITKAVAGALKAKLLTQPGAVVQSDRPPSGSLAAYTAYLRGIGAANLGTEQSQHDAIAAFGEAIQLDPKYAAAYAQLSGTWTGLAAQYLSGTQARQAYAKARAAASTALALKPDLALAHEARSNLLSNADMNQTDAEVEARRALQLAPNDAHAKFILGTMLATLGQVGRAAELTRQALKVDPRRANWYRWQADYLAALGRLDAAAQAARTAMALRPGATANAEQLAIVEILRGNAKAALAAAQREPAGGGWRGIALALALQIGPDPKAADAALKKLIADQANAAAYQIAEVYALRRDPDNMFKWLDHAWANRDPGIGYLLFDPLILRYRHDPRFAAFCRKAGLPTTTDAVAMKL